MKNSVQSNSFRKMPRYSAQLLWLFIFGVSILNGYAQTTTCANTAFVGSGAGSYGELGDGKGANRNTFEQYSINMSLKQMSVGSQHTIVIKTDGSLWGWGANNSGGLGVSTSGFAVISPVQIDSGKNWKQASSYDRGGAAVKTDGSLWAWGGLPLISSLPYNTPRTSTPVQIGTDTDWKQVNNFYALKTDGSLWRWGGAVRFGGDTNGTIRQMGTSKDWKEIQSGYVLKNDGSLWTLDSLKQVGTDRDWKQISSAGHTLAIKNDGSLWAWGNNQFGQLGDGTKVNKINPIRIGTDNDWMEVSVSANQDGAHSTALKTNGSLWVWGSNNRGQLGDGTGDKIVPTGVVETIGNCLHVYAGPEQTIALRCIEPYTLDPTQCYLIVNKLTGRTLEVKDASQANGIQIYQWAITGKAHQLWQFVKLADGTYNIISKNSGKLMDVVGRPAVGVCADGTVIEQVFADGTSSQKWRLELLANGAFRLYNVNCNKAIAVEYGNSGDGGAVGVRGVASLDQWLIQKVTCSPTCLLAPSVSGSNTVGVGTTTTLTGSATTGTAVWSSSDNTIATVSTTGVVTGLKAGIVTISYKITEGSCTATATKTITVNPATCNLTPSVSGSSSINIGATTSLIGSTTTGTAVWKSSDSTIATVSATGVVKGLKTGLAVIVYRVTEGTCTQIASKTITVGTPPSNFDATKCYQLIARHSGKVAEIAEHSVLNGVNIQQGTWGYSRRQVWRIKSIDGTYYQIMNGYSGEVMDVKGNYLYSGANIQQGVKNGGDNQKWRFDKNTEGYYFITAKHSGMVVDVKGVSLLDGANIQQSTKNGGQNQQWTVSQIGCPVGTAASESAQIYAADGYRDGHKGILTWVSNAANADYFSVEKQNKNGDFETLENVNAKLAATYSDKNYYSYTDNQAVEGDNIYRIGLVADNAPPQYSPLISLNFKAAMDFSIYPNPTSDYVDVDLTTYENRPVTLTLIDASGHEMQRLSVEKAGKTQRFVLDDLTNGLYLVRIQTVGKRDVTRVFNLTK